MLKRAISGFIGLGLFLLLCFSGAATYDIATTVVALICAWEWVTAYRRPTQGEPGATSSAPSPLNALLPMLAALYPIGLYWGLRHRTYQPQLIDAVLLAAPPLMFAGLTFRAARTGSALGRLRRWNGLIGAVYIGMLLGSFVLLRDLGPRLSVTPFGAADRGAWLMLLVALCVWAGDTAAYFVGRSLGRKKLAPTLSPGKTVEGAVGGLVGSIVVGAGFGHWFGIPLTIGLGFGVLAGTFGPLGDLWESALKRELGIKDFGGVMPGHGGALDRFDSLLFVAPLAFLYLRCLGG